MFLFESATVYNYCPIVWQMISQTLGVEVLDNRMDCIPSKNLLPTLKLNTEGQTYLTFTFMLQYNLVGERFFLFPWQLSWSSPTHKGILRNDTQGFFL